MKFFLPVLLCISLMSAIYSQSWESLDEGTNHLIQELYSDTIGDFLYAGGNFKMAGSDSIKCIARWNGYQWLPMGNGVAPSCDTCECSVIYGITRFQGDIYASGNFRFKGQYDPDRYVARWNGSSWDSVTVLGIYGSVWGLSATEEYLYTYGTFDTIAGIPASKIAKYDGQNWSAIDTTVWKLHGIYTAAFYEGELYVGGNFRNEDSTIRGMARWDGSQWHSVGEPLVGTFSWVRTMAVFRDELYLAGIFLKEEGNVGNAIVRWNGHVLRDVGGGAGPRNAQIWDLLVFDDKLFAAGAFWTAGQEVYSPNLAYWDGWRWCGLENDFTTLVILRLANFRDTLHLAMGGGTIDGVDVNFAARWTGETFNSFCEEVTAVNTPAGSGIRLAIFPNPVTDDLKIQTGKLRDAADIRIYNVTGQTFYSGKWSADQHLSTFTLEVTQWPPGLYLLELQTGGQRVVRKFIITR